MIAALQPRSLKDKATGRVKKHYAITRCLLEVFAEFAPEQVKAAEVVDLHDESLHVVQQKTCARCPAPRLGVLIHRSGWVTLTAR